MKCGLPLPTQDLDLSRAMVVGPNLEVFCSIYGIWRLFSQIDYACKGLLHVATKTKIGFNLVEAKIKVKYNYSSFFQACIRITNDSVISFSIKTVSHSQGK